MNKTLITLLAIPFFALSGCKDDVPDFYKCKSEGKYIISAFHNGTGNNVTIKPYTSDRSRPYSLHASDNVLRENKQDGRFDMIELFNVPAGDSIEKYMNLGTINKLFQEVKDTGCDCDSLYARLGRK